MNQTEKSGNALTSFIRYASLNSLGMLALSCYILADTFFIARGIGSDGLTALNLALPVYSFVYGTGLMLGMGGAALYSIHRSRGEETKADAIFTTGIILLTAAAIVYLLLGLFASGWITSLLGADESVYTMTQTYLRIILLFSPFFMLNNYLLSFVRNDGAPHLAMAGMIIGSLGNVVLDYLFIFPLKMGILGAVLATGCAPIMSLLLMLPYLFSSKRGFHLAHNGLSVKNITSICSTGLPSLLSELSSGIVIIVFNYLILKILGNTGVAAYGIVANLSLVVIAIYTGIAQGVQPLFSTAYGLKNFKEQSALFRYGLVTVIGISFLLYIGIYEGADWIAGVFNSGRDALLQKTAVEGLKLYFIGGIFAGINILFATYFAAVNHPMPAQVISFLRGFAVIIPMAVLLASFGGIKGVWLAFPAAEGLVAVVGVIFLKRTYRQEA